MNVDAGSLLYHVDGELVPAEDATVNVRDRGFTYGDAAFETLRAYGGEVFEWGAHADRLRGTCEVLQLDHGLSDAGLKARIDETLAANGLEEAYVKLSISRGIQPGKLDPDPEVDPTVVVYVSPLPRGGTGAAGMGRTGRGTAGTGTAGSDAERRTNGTGTAGADAEGKTTDTGAAEGGRAAGPVPVWDGPAALQTTKTRRIPDGAIPSHAKTHNYLNGILARLELRPSDADEAMMLDEDGYVAECATSNLFFADGNALKTPSLEGPVLPGITREVLLEIAADEGIPTVEGRFTPDDVRSADEVFLTNSTWEVRPVATVDGIDLTPDDPERTAGPITTLLAELFRRRVERLHYSTDD